MTKADETKPSLEQALLALKTSEQRVPDSLRQRVLADAYKTQPIAGGLQAPSRRRTMLASIGGWPSLVTMASAVLVGVWIGRSSHPLIEDAVGYYISDDVVMLSLDVFEPELFAEE